MKNQFIKTTTLLAMFFSVFASCSSEAELDDETNTISALHPAFAEFDTNETTIYLSGADVVIEATGLPNHTTPYWSESHALYVAPTVTNTGQMTPTRIDTSGRDNSSSVTVSTSPDLANSTTATALGAIGVAVSGAYLYND